MDCLSLACARNKGVKSWSLLFFTQNNHHCTDFIDSEKVCANVSLMYVFRYIFHLSIRGAESFKTRFTVYWFIGPCAVWDQDHRLLPPSWILLHTRPWDLGRALNITSGFNLKIGSTHFFALWRPHVVNSSLLKASRRDEEALGEESGSTPWKEWHPWTFVPMNPSPRYASVLVTYYSSMVSFVPADTS